MLLEILPLKIISKVEKKTVLNAELKLKVQDGGPKPITAEINIKKAKLRDVTTNPSKKLYNIILIELLSSLFCVTARTTMEVITLIAIQPKRCLKVKAKKNQRAKSKLLY